MPKSQKRVATLPGRCRRLLFRALRLQGVRHEPRSDRRRPVSGASVQSSDRNRQSSFTSGLAAPGGLLLSLSRWRRRPQGVPCAFSTANPPPGCRFGGDFTRADLRLAPAPALEHQRSQPAAGQRDSLPASDSVGTISLADDRDSAAILLQAASSAGCCSSIAAGTRRSWNARPHAASHSSEPHRGGRRPVGVDRA